MPRMIFTLTEEMDVVIKEEARRRKSPVSAIIREALADYFAKQGKHIDDVIMWGKSKSDQDEGKM